MKSPGNGLVPAAELIQKPRLKFPKRSGNHHGLDLQLYGFLLSSLAPLRGFPLISVSFMEGVSAKTKYKEVGQKP